MPDIPVKFEALSEDFPVSFSPSDQTLPVQFETVQEVLTAKLQEKSVIPSEEPQTVEPDDGYDGMSRVLVDRIPDPETFSVLFSKVTQANATCYYVTPENTFAYKSGNAYIPDQKVGSVLIIRCYLTNSSTSSVQKEFDPNISVTGGTYKQIDDIEYTTTTKLSATTVTKTHYVRIYAVVITEPGARVSV